MKLMINSFAIKDYDDPDERYYACVVDKNRAGAKPKLLFNLNLAYNRWVELGYLRLKDEKIRLQYLGGKVSPFERIETTLTNSVSSKLFLFYIKVLRFNTRVNIENF